MPVTNVSFEGFCCGNQHLLLRFLVRQPPSPLLRHPSLLLLFLFLGLLLFLILLLLLLLLLPLLLPRLQLLLPFLLLFFLPD